MGEIASDEFGSGGGFSQQFAQPIWQQAAAAAFLQAASRDTPFPPDGSFPPLGRATPDVAALGEGYQVVLGGRANTLGGTSASTPAFAGMVSLSWIIQQSQTG